MVDAPVLTRHKLARFEAPEYGVITIGFLIMAQASPPLKTAKFVTGSTMRHVIVMTASSTAGLIAIFIVDFINLYFLSLLNQIEVTAAVGYAGSILFFTISIGIGLSIAAAALISPAIGRLDWPTAERLTVNVSIFTAVATAALSAIVWWFTPDLLTTFGATGRTHELARNYLWILIPSTPVLALGMCGAAVLRSLGDARRAMYVTLFGAIAAAILDPLFIFALDLGIEGAAIASVLARFVILGAAIYGVVFVHRLVRSYKVEQFHKDMTATASIAIPAILTNVATPVANAYVTSAMAPFGDGAVAAWAIIGRVLPVAFAGVFALTGAIGPIIGQNLGAGSLPRVRQSLTDALIFTFCYSMAAWAALAIFHGELSALFNVSGETAGLIRFFCLWITPLFTFLGAQFIANAVFNNLGRPQFSTVLNWGRATLGTVPFVALGAMQYGAPGVIAGNMAGGLIFGILSIALCYRYITKIENRSMIKP